MARKVHYASGHIRELGCERLDEERHAHWTSGVNDELIHSDDDGEFWSTKYTKPAPITRSCITKVTCQFCLHLLDARVLYQKRRVG
jgi:hypothetical protein